MHRGFAILQLAGPDGLDDFILGQPNETRQSMLRTIELAVELNAEVSVFGRMVPYPGTEGGRMAALDEGK